MKSISRLVHPKTGQLVDQAEIIFNSDEFDTLHEDEWKGEVDPEGYSRLEENPWKDRYEYESKLILQIIKDNPSWKAPYLLASKCFEKNNQIIKNKLGKL